MPDDAAPYAFDTRAPRSLRFTRWFAGTKNLRTRGLLALCAAALPTLTVLPGRVSAQAAALTGVVLADPGEQPLANAEILLSDLKVSTRSDSAGKFVLSGLPAGKHAVLVRLPGYQPFSAELRFGTSGTLDLDFLMKPVGTTLKKVEVTATRDASPFAIKLAEFEERRAMGVGKFLTADYFEQQDGRPPSSFLMAKIAGLKIVQVNGRRFLASTRGGKGGGVSFEPVPSACYMQVVVNGLIRYNGMPGQQVFDIDELNSKDIIGFEFYTTATTPLQYNSTRGAGSGACGTVIIWTKGG